MISRAQNGNLIEFKKEFGVNCHWAVYVGNDYVIINYGRKEPTPTIVQKEKLIQLDGDSPCRINNLESAADSMNLRSFLKPKL